MCPETHCPEIPQRRATDCINAERIAQHMEHAHRFDMVVHRVHVWLMISATIAALIMLQRLHMSLEAVSERSKHIEVLINEQNTLLAAHNALSHKGAQ